MLTRRDFLKMAGLGAGAMLLNACAPKQGSSIQGLGKFIPPTGTSLPQVTNLPTVTLLPTLTILPTQTLGPIGTPVPPKLCFVLWDHQLALYNYRPRNLYNPLPETCSLYSGAKNLVTPAWEAYWRGLLHLCNPAVADKQFESAWISLVDSNRAFTNFSGPKTGEFYLHSITCGGATHEMVTGVSDGKHMEIYTLNSKLDPPPVPSRREDIDMTRHFFATTGSNVRLSDGSYAVYGFPQFENCIVPLLSPSNTDKIDVSRIKVVTSIQRPYNP